MERNNDLNKKLDMRVSEGDKALIKEAGAILGGNAGIGYTTWCRGVLVKEAQRIIRKHEKGAL